MAALAKSMIALLCTVSVTSFAQGGPVTMEKVEFGGWENCIQLTNGKIELIVTTDVGPRVIRLGFVDGQNLFKTYDAMMGKTGGDEWMIYGGHRLWAAPEAKPRTYELDNFPIQYNWDGKSLLLKANVDKRTGIAKEIEITMDPDADHVEVVHRLVNTGSWDVELAPWALSVMAPGGTLVIPQEPFISHTEKLLPARPIVLWHYTNMADPRYTWGKKYILLRQDSKAEVQTKFGVLNSLGWAAYALNGDLFLKHYPFEADAEYPDFGVNTESYTDHEMLELETLGPLSTLPANGGSVEHTEDWFLYKKEIGKDEAGIDQALLPLVEQSSRRVSR